MVHHENHPDNSGRKLNWLRASVLGANDGVVSVASIVVGVAGATNSSGFIVTAGIAGITAGALSMAVGEYISVSTQRDTERAILEKERIELQDNPESERLELVSIYEKKGLSRETAEKVALELTEHDAFAAHAEAELRINPKELTSPWQAAAASAASFLSGGIIPLVAIAFPPASFRIVATIVAVIVALIVTGILSAKAGGSSKIIATTRVVLGGIIAMAVTFGIGRLFGVVGL